MTGNNRLQIVFILFFFLGVIVFAQDNTAYEDQKLREEILAVYKAGGENGLQDYLKKNKDKITSKFIVDFTEAGVKERKEEWLKICKTLAEGKKDEKIIADVLYETGEYFRLTSDYKNATDYFEKALHIYQKLNYPVGQGDVYLGKGDIYATKGENSKAIEMYDKAMPFFEKNRNINGQGHVYIRKGRIYFFTGDNTNALNMYDKAIYLFEKAKNISMQGQAYLLKGNVYLITSKSSMAIEMFEKALLLFKKSRSITGLGNTYFSMGQIVEHRGQTTKALELYDKALSFFKKAKDYVGQGNVYLKKGDIYNSIGENSKAFKMYDKALFFSEKTQNLLNIGNIYICKGYLYFKIGEYKTALLLYDKALGFFIKANEPRGQANVYMERGTIYHYTGEYSKAFEELDKALIIFKSTDDYLGQGNVYQNKGIIYINRCEYLKAVEMFDKALLLYKKDSHYLGEGNIYLRKGDIYYRTGDYSKAHAIYEEALSIFREIQDHLSLGNIYFKLGKNALISGKSSDALKMVSKALHYFEKGGYPGEQGNVYQCIGEIHFDNENNSKALEMYNKALPFFEKVGNHMGQGNIHLLKGDIYLKNGDNSKALALYNKALNFFKKVGNIEAESITLYLKAKVVAKLWKKDKVLPLFEKSIDNLEKVREQTAFSLMKRTFIEKTYKQYEETVLFMLENNYYDKGFIYAESMKSRVFMDRMAEELVRLEKGLKPDLKEKRDNLVAKLSSISKQIHEVAGGKDESKLKELKEQYRKTGDEFDELLIKIRLENPLYASVRYPQPISVQELQKEILKRGEILVRYFISPGKLYVFLISKKKFKVFPLEVKKDEIKSDAQQYLGAFKDNNSIRMKRYGKILYEKLFKPLEKRIKKSKDIIIVPDRDLATIPFESLIVDNKGQDRPVFLLEKYRVKYLQSASLLKILRQQYQKKRETNSFIGFGDPVYDYENFKLGKPEKGSMKILATESTEGTEDEIKEIHRDRYARAGGIMDRLPASGEEVKTIARLFEKESQKSVIYLREEATEDNACTPGMKDFDYIHFTCHGLLNDDFQSLVLSQLPPDKSKEDGYFTLNEIMNCDYNAKLVVLSACQTGSGKLERAEGVTGMTRAIMYAGTPAVAASLWKVDDEATKELMINFYQNILEKNLDKAEALRQAKLTLIKNKKYRSPLFWSSFVMYGE